MTPTEYIETIKLVKRKFNALSPHLDERSRRIWAATEALSYGYSGSTIVHKATGIDYKTIRRGIDELNNPIELEQGKIRQKGGGRKKLLEVQTGIVESLERLVEPVTSGDPESLLRWTCKSTYKLADELKNQGYKICQKSVCNLLNVMNYTLQSNSKSRGETNHKDRNEQFEHINQQAHEFQDKSQPVISVDTKKKEIIGNFKNNGREYSIKYQPIEVNVHDFCDKDNGKVSPYGIYDLSKNTGWVNVGISGDTAEFAVESIRQWWYEMGKEMHQDATDIYITADSGGSNGYRVRLWKLELQKLANELQMNIFVSHFPPGTSKWNKIEHKMFSFISQNWRGRPLIDRATVVNLIGNTKTKTGLTIRARLDEREYKKGIKVSDGEFKNILLIPNEFHGEWNYQIRPQSGVK